MPASRNAAAVLAAAAMVALIAGLAMTGRSPGGQALQRFTPRGIVAPPPADIRTIEIRLGPERLAFHREGPGAWLFDSPSAEVPTEVEAHLEAALRFMHVSAPARTLDPDEYRGTSLAEFGLDPPAYVVTLGAAGVPVAIADFGALNPAQTSQYVRLLGRPTLYLMPRHVGAEWQLAADLAKRALPPAHRDGPPAAELLLPASIDQIWAVELVSGGALHRFERDGAGRWFLHTGQHSHVGGTNAHVADPVQAPVIAAALDGFGETQIEGRAALRPTGADLEQFGLSRPSLIALLYARDNSTPLARVEIGSAAKDGFSRYARLAPTGDVVMVADYEAQRLADLLKAVGVMR